MTKAKTQKIRKTKNHHSKRNKTTKAKTLKIRKTKNRHRKRKKMTKAKALKIRKTKIIKSLRKRRKRKKRERKMTRKKRKSTSQGCLICLNLALIGCGPPSLERGISQNLEGNKVPIHYVHW